MAIVTIIIIALIFLIASIPLHLAASFLGGHSSLIKAALTNLIAGIVGALVFVFFAKYAVIAYFIAILFIYKVMFDIGWIRALFVWIMELVITIGLILLLTFLGVLVL